MKQSWRRVATLLVAGALVVAACSGDDDDASSDSTAGGAESSDTLRVPDDYATIQAAVSAAAPGDLVLVGPGVYEEAVDVETEDLTIRGLDRNEVVLEGGFTLENGMRVLADGVAIENMTAQNFTTNGFFWTGVTGYRGSYLNAIRNGDYGVYAFDAVKGQFDHIYAAGSPDAGIYIGQCYPCDAVVTDVISEHNGLGYSGTNAGGNLVHRELDVAQQPRRHRAEQRLVRALLSAARRHDRRQHRPRQQPTRYPGDRRRAARHGQRHPAHWRQSRRDRTQSRVRPRARRHRARPLSRGRSERCRTSRVGVGHALRGDEGRAARCPGSLRARNVFWNSTGNRVVGNVVSGSGLGDLAAASIGAELSTLGNCFSDNTFGTSAPADLEALAPCDGTATATDWNRGALDLGALIAAARPPAVDYETAPLPDVGPQPSMPDAETAPVRPASDGPEPVDTDAIALPTRPPGA